MLRLVRSSYPGLLESNQELLFKLKCRQFVEMIAGYDTAEFLAQELRLSCHSELSCSSEEGGGVGGRGSPSVAVDDGAFLNGEVHVCVKEHLSFMYSW